MAAEQIELRLAVAVCAWCRRKTNPARMYSPEVSHGICPRHLKMLHAEMLVLKGEASPAAPQPVVRKLRKEPDEANLPLAMDDALTSLIARTKSYATS